jgi:hypothetical protein
LDKTHMKKFRVLFALILFTAAVFLLTSFIGPVKGSVDPSNGALRAFLFSKTDTINTAVVQGIFEFNNVKPGNYTLMIEGVPPYQNATKQDITVTEGQPTDVGVIQMNQ